MKVDILASGSGGNCISIRSGDRTILVDAGIPKTKIERRLLDAGIRPDEIDAILVTHAHKDHTCGLPLANKYRIPVHASAGEWKDIRGVDEGLKKVIEVPMSFRYGNGQGFDVYPFQTHHDAYEPMGYAIKFEAGGKVSICLDTGHVDWDMLRAMRDSDIYIIEANHDTDLVKVSGYPESVKARILSDFGHLSNRQTAEALHRLVQGRGERIYLTHLSGNNNMPELALGDVEGALRRRGLVNGKHYFCEVV